MGYLKKVFRTVAGETAIMENKNSGGVGTTADIKRYAHIGICVITNGFTGTVKFQGSFLENTDTNLDYSSSPSGTNRWGYCAVRNHDDATFIDGNTGKSFTTDTGVYQYELNTWTLRSMNVEISGYSAGTISIYIYPVNNQ